MSDVAAAICRYADRFHRDIGDTHHVASPLGAWLVLALAAAGARDDRRAQLADVLGCPVDEAAACATDLLRNPHQAVVLAAAAWHERYVETEALTMWLRGLAREVERGPVPSQDGADAWAAAKSLGMIERFPLDVDPSVVLVVASALATRISWVCPFEVVDTDDLVLPRAAGFAGLSHVLADPGEALVEAIVDTEVGAVAVHAAGSKDGDLAVVSVIADPAVTAADVLRVAHSIACATGIGRLPHRRSLFGLPLGAGHSWTLSEFRAPDGPTECFDTRLPAWSAESAHELLGNPALGFGPAVAALRALLPPGDWSADARQVAVARYKRTGFEAAAITGLAVASSAVAADRPVRVRTARVEFTRPYAVVAVARGDMHSPWAGLPVFSAWISRGDEPDPDD